MTAVAAPNGHAARRLDSAGPLRVVLASWAPFHAGAEVAAERLALGLQEQGHAVTVVLATKGVTLERMQSNGVDVRFIPLILTDKFKWWQYYRAQRQLRQLLIEIQPDVVHANDLPTSQMIGQVAARLGIPRVCHHRWIFSGRAADWLNKFGAERHIFVSRSIMDEMCGAATSISQSCVTVVDDGVPMPPLPQETDRRQARIDLNLPVDKQVVMFAGQIIERKGLADLINAWALMPDNRKLEAELVIVGDDLENRGLYRRQMESLASRLRVPARFVGFRRDVPNWIVAADICVVPSHIEPFGLSVLEAMAHGRAVIGANVGGIPEMIVDGVTGRLVPPGDPERLTSAIDEFLGDAELRHRLGRAARRRSEDRFSLTAHIDAVVCEYRKVVASQTYVTS